MSYILQEECTLEKASQATFALIICVYIYISIYKHLKVQVN